MHKAMVDRAHTLYRERIRSHGEWEAKSWVLDRYGWNLYKTVVLGLPLEDLDTKPRRNRGSAEITYLHSNVLQFRKPESDPI